MTPRKKPPTTSLIFGFTTHKKLGKHRGQGSVEELHVWAATDTIFKFVFQLLIRF